MEKPTKCKWCGCGDILFPATDYLQFLCQSSVFNGFWVRGEECAVRVHGQAVEMQDRIKRAIELLEGTERYDVEACEDSVSFDYHDHGQQADAEVLDQALEILRGNSSESPDSSPVTADQLATEDYFEAVRQRVPWMTSIEHIEGLIEGYRQCGLMVWKAAEQIKLIFGGGQ